MALVPDPASPPAGRWEYRVALHAAAPGTGEFDSKALQRELNEIGREGWELVSVIDTKMHGGSTSRLVATFKRPLA